MQLTIGISPCPNDTYIFEYIYNKQFTIEGIELQFLFADVQELNKMAQNQSVDIIKMSYANFFAVSKHYTLLKCGGAMGYGVGPLLVQKTGATFNAKEATIAIPGWNTTANLLLEYLLPIAKNKKALLFSDIENAVLNNDVSAGLLIHENRFTYAEKGLEKIIDLGEEWEAKTNLPTPLGCIAIKKNIDIEITKQIDDIILQSILESEKKYPVISEFVQQYAQEMSVDIMRKHIDLYVNNFSKGISSEAQLAIDALQKTYNTMQHFI